MRYVIARTPEDLFVVLRWLDFYRIYEDPDRATADAVRRDLNRAKK